METQVIEQVVLEQAPIPEELVATVSPDVAPTSIETPIVYDTYGASFSLDAVLRSISELPDVSVSVEEPFANSGSWVASIHGTSNKTKWLLVSINPTKQEISTEHFMTYSAIGATWRMVNNKPIVFKTIDDAMNEIETLLAS
jgi:hypothetical protein